MKIQCATTQDNADKFIGFLTLGVLYCLKKKIISIDEAEIFIFNPWFPDLLKEINLCDELISVLKLGCELEDVESLIPERLQYNINKLFNRTLSAIKNDNKLDRHSGTSITITDEKAEV